MVMMVLRLFMCISSFSSVFFLVYFYLIFIPRSVFFFGLFYYYSFIFLLGFYVIHLSAFSVMMIKVNRLKKNSNA